MIPVETIEFIIEFLNPKYIPLWWDCSMNCEQSIFNFNWKMEIIIKRTTKTWFVIFMRDFPIWIIISVSIWMESVCLSSFVWKIWLMVQCNLCSLSFLKKIPPIQQFYLPPKNRRNATRGIISVLYFLHWNWTKFR